MTDRTPPRRRRLIPDPRLLLGIALIAASVAGVVAVVTAADRRVEVYVAASDLTPGQTVGADEVLVRQVALDDAAARYLAPGDLPPEGLVAVATIRQGELVPRSSLGEAAGLDATALVLELDGEVSSTVEAGAVVDVWATAEPSTFADADDDTGPVGAFGAPVVLSPDAVVVRVLDDDGLVSGGEGRSVEVLIPRIRVARLLQAIANGDALAIVPAGVPLAPR